jgi:Cof subfamily protein (haloacid dehalogenase superfamily)
MNQHASDTHQSKIQTPRGYLKSEIKLIATDIDGTLLDSENRLPAANHRALQQTVAHGVQLALVTARKRASTLEVAELLDLPCACVAHNGARVWDWNGDELQHLVVDFALACDLARLADQWALPLIMTVNEVNYYSAAYPFDPSFRSPSEQPVASCVDALTAPPTRIIVAGERGIDRLSDMLQSSAEQMVLHRYYSREGTLASAVITHPQATKEAAVALLADRIGARPSEVLALGDAQADAGMLRWAGIGVAMGNAMPEARSAADWIAPSHDDAGFAAAIKRFVLGNDEG